MPSSESSESSKKTYYIYLLKADGMKQTNQTKKKSQYGRNEMYERYPMSTLFKLYLVNSKELPFL